MENYKCEICGKKHDIFRGIESPLPDLLTDIPEEEKESRVNELNGLYIIDRKWILGKGYIYIEMEGLDEPIFCWQVWVTISPKDFQDNFENLMNGQTVELRGVLQSKLPFYKKSKGLESTLTIQASNELAIEVLVIEKSKLKEDQLKLISESRVIEIMQMIYHPSERKERQNFEEPFDKRFLEELNNAEEEYIKKKRNFVINISNANTVLFQIVSNKILETNRIKKRGFGLHISFDDSFEEGIEEIAKFRSKEYAKNFDYHNLGNIPTYQIDLGTNRKRLEELVKKIVVDIYKEDIEIIETDNFEI